MTFPPQDGPPAEHLEEIERIRELDSTCAGDVRLQKALKAEYDRSLQVTDVLPDVTERVADHVVDRRSQTYTAVRRAKPESLGNSAKTLHMR